MARLCILSILSLMIGMLVCVSCGTKESSSTSEAPATKAYQLTADEYDKVFAGSSAIRKLASPDGVAVKAVRIEIIENGKVLSSLGANAGDAKMLTKIIAVVETEGDTHLTRLYLEHAHGSVLSSSNAWFSKQLTASSRDNQIGIAPIRPGRIVLLSGDQVPPPTTGGTLVRDTGSQAPCRIELVVE